MPRRSIRRRSAPAVAGLFVVALLVLAARPAAAQVPATDPLYRTMAALDSVVFEAGFNRCDLAALDAVVADDLTFYHDQGGVQDKAAFMRATRDNICSTPERKPIRRAVPGSIEVFPLYTGDGRLYGALQSGEHTFHLREPGRAPYPTGAAAFSSLWLRDDAGAWRLTHVLSYDHRPLSARPPADAPAFAPLAATLDSLRRAHRIPGLAAAVVRDGETVWADGFGVADVDEGTPVTPDTPFWIASITKTFVGLTFLQLAADGAVDLDAPLAEMPGFVDFCGWLAGTDLPFGRGLDCAAPITARHLLTHTANGRPGEAFLYNPLLYSRLARYAEWTANDSTEVEGGMNELARQVDARILAPAGLRRTVASQWDRSRPDVVLDMARGYGVDGDGWTLRPQPKRALTAGAGVVSTVLDLGRYVGALGDGRLAPPALVDRLLTPPAGPDGAPLPYAYGWYVQTYRGERLAWHAGWDPDAGTSSLLLWLPDRRLAFVVLANGEGVWWGNPLDAAAVERAPFAQAFLDRFVFGQGAE